MADWSTEYINDLPDSAFMYIEEGGEKDEEGKTTPRSLRHLPYKDKEGNIDLPHVRNALARLNQVELKDGSKLPEDKREEIRNKLEKILEENTEQSSSSEGSENSDKKQTQNSDENGEQNKSDDSNNDADTKSDSSGSSDTDGEKKEETQHQDENQEGVSEREFIEFIASHYDGVGPEGMAGLLEKMTFKGIDEKELATLVANVVDKKTGEVLKYFESAKKGQAMYSNDSQSSQSVEQFSGSLKEALNLNEDMMETLNESRKEIDSYKQLNEDLLKRLNQKEKELEQKQKEISKYEEEKKQQRVDKVFDQYCEVFDISEGEKNNVYQMLSNMSEDMLERTEALMKHKPKSQENEKNYTQPSHNLTQYEDNSNKGIDAETWNKMSGKEKADYLFKQYIQK